MTFDIYSPEGIHFVQYFDTIDELIISMIKNSGHAYHRIT